MSSLSHISQWRTVLTFLVLVLVASAAFLVSPSDVSSKEGYAETQLTLRQILSQASHEGGDGFSLAMAPAFFGFYGK